MTTRTPREIGTDAAATYVTAALTGDTQQVKAGAVAAMATLATAGTPKRGSAAVREFRVALITEHGVSPALANKIATTVGRHVQQETR